MTDNDDILSSRVRATDLAVMLGRLEGKLDSAIVNVADLKADINRLGIAQDKISKEQAADRARIQALETSDSNARDINLQRPAIVAAIVLLATFVTSLVALFRHP